MDEILLMEALLFSSGRPFSLKELGEALNLEPQTVRKYVKKLKGLYGKRNTALEVAKVGSKYCLQVKREYVGNTSRFVRTKIPPKLLKTLAFIAYHQPVKQSAMVHLVGVRVYDEVKELTRLELIHRKRSGHTKILTTSSKFPEYFGIGTSTREGIKNWLREKMGMNDDEIPAGEKSEPVGGEGEPVEGESDPVRVEGEPMEGESTPVGAEGEPMEGESIPVGAEGEPMEGESNPVRAEGEPMEEESEPGGAKNDPAGDEPQKEEAGKGDAEEKVEDGAKHETDPEE